MQDREKTYKEKDLSPWVNEGNFYHLQQKHGPTSICFGCGPANSSGLRIVSMGSLEDSMIFAKFLPKEAHQAFPGVVNGGILGALLDCHSNWNAAFTLMKSNNLDAPPCTVTADFHVTLRRPTPLVELLIRAYPIEIGPDRVRVRASVEAAGKLTAICEGLFVSVQPGHPAYHRWG